MKQEEELGQHIAKQLPPPWAACSISSTHLHDSVLQKTKVSLDLSWPAENLIA